MRVKIIGGGFSGLAMAYALCKKGCAVELHEKSDRLGGLIQTEHNAWGLVEKAANGILASENVVQLFEDVGLPYQNMRKDTGNRYIFRDKPQQLPLTPLEITRMSVGFLRRPRPQRHQTLQSYAESIFGYGAANYLIEPALFGIFAEKPEELSANLVYDYFFKFKPKKSKLAKGTLAPEKGMESLLKKMGDYIQANGAVVHLNSKTDLSDNEVNVIATNAPEAARLLETRDEWVSSQLEKVEYISLSSVSLGYRQSTRNLKGFGCLFPSREDFHCLGVLFNGDIFENRGPFDTETWLIRKVDGLEEEILDLVLKDRQRLLGDEQKPDEFSVKKWDKAIPKYSIELEQVLNELVLPSKVYLAGNYLGHLGLGKILDQCLETADKVVKLES